MIQIRAWLRRLADGIAIALPVIALQWAVFGARLQAVETNQAQSLARYQVDRALWARNECLEMRTKNHPIPDYLALDCAAVFERYNLEYPK